MPEAALVRMLEIQELDGLKALLAATPELLHKPVPGALLPEALGRGQEGNTALHVAAFCGGRAILKHLIELGAAVDARNAENRTPAHVALEHNFEAIQDLEQLGVEKDHIHAACRHDHERLNKLLHDDPSLASDRSTGLSVLGWATYYGAKVSAEMLLDHGAKPDGRELHCAAGIANPELGELLLEHGADMNERDDGDGATPLHIAIAHPYSCDAVEFVELLLGRGADPSIRAAKREVTPLELARDKLAKQEKAGIAAGHPDWKNFAGVIELLEKV